MYRRHGRVYYHRGVSRWRGMGYEVLAILTWPVCFDSYAALAGMLLPRNLRERLHRGWNRVFGRTRKRFARIEAAGGISRGRNRRRGVGEG